MSCFLLPKGLCSRIEKAVCSFWWGTNGTKNKIHLTKKGNLFKSKHEGGMGFKTLRDFNMEMLAKQTWRLHTNPTTLLAKCFKAKYFPHTDILQATTGCNPSYAWRSIQSSIWVINKGSCWGIGNGNSVKVWRDNWIPMNHGFKVVTTAEAQSPSKMVEDLVQQDPLRWDSDILSSHLLPIDKAGIEQIPLLNKSQSDDLMWVYYSTGIYTVKSGYRAIKEWQS